MSDEYLKSLKENIGALRWQWYSKGTDHFDGNYCCNDPQRPLQH